jgi:hypothetical protein
MVMDIALSETPLNGMTTFPVEETNRDENTIMMRHRIARNDAEHGAADEEPEGDSGSGGEVPRDEQPDDDAGSIEEKIVTPRQKYHCYLQSGMEKVSDVEDWK